MKTVSLWSKIILAVVFVRSLEAMAPSRPGGHVQTPPAVAAVIGDAMRFKIPDGAIGYRGRPNAHLFDPGPHMLVVGQFVERAMDMDASEISGAGMSETWDTSAQLARSFTERDRYLMAVAASYHDVGKIGGDPSNYTFQDDGTIAFNLRLNHELIGFYYALTGILDGESLRAVGQHLHDAYGIDFTDLHEYISLSGQHVKNLFDWAELTIDEQRLVAVLIGSHKIFTQVCMNDPALYGFLPLGAPVTPEAFVVFLRDLCVTAGLPEAAVNAKLVDMIILLTLSDSYAVFFRPASFVPSRIIGPEYAATLHPRRNSLHGEKFLVRGKQWPGDERGFQGEFNKLFEKAAHTYRAAICALL